MSETNSINIFAPEISISCLICSYSKTGIRIKLRGSPSGARKSRRVRRRELFHVEKLRSPKSWHESAGTLDELGASITEAAMSRWTDEELRELVTLWPTHSVSQLVELLHRPRWAIRSKAKRLRLLGLRPHNPSEDGEAITPPKRRWRRGQIMLPRSPRPA